ncbi:MAG TPA: glycosyltransferase [Thermoanaerobaculia bacterium]|nr:glycosyltransferase [Thermoanaerobaculia bacterium]
MTDGASPLVSVIIATYNWSSVLRHAIASALEQTFPSFEILVVGDGCTDDSAEAVAAFGDPRLRWHNLPSNSGSQAGPNNAGISLARGEYVAYLGHDDVWHPTHLETLVDLARRRRGDLFHTLAAIVHPDGERQISGLTGSGELGPGDFAVPSSVLHPRRLTEEIGPWPDPLTIDLPIDADLWERARHAGKVFVTAERLTVFKFPSSTRRGSYVERPSHEQAEIRRRLREEPDLQFRELLEITRSFLVRGPRPVRAPAHVENTPPGWIARQLRQIRGLDAPDALMEPLPAELAPELLELRAEGVPAHAAPGQRLPLQVEVRNRSDFTLASVLPNPVHLSYHWIGEDGGMAVYDAPRAALVPPLPAGSDGSYGITVTAPGLPGRYTLRLALVQENVRWYDEPREGAEWPVEVG